MVSHLVHHSQVFSFCLVSRLLERTKSGQLHMRHRWLTSLSRKESDLHNQNQYTFCKNVKYNLSILILSLSVL